MASCTDVIFWIKKYFEESLYSDLRHKISSQLMSKKIFQWAKIMTKYGLLCLMLLKLALLLYVYRSNIEMVSSKTFMIKWIVMIPLLALRRINNPFSPSSIAQELCLVLFFRIWFLILLNVEWESIMALFISLTIVSRIWRVLPVMHFIIFLNVADLNNAAVYVGGVWAVRILHNF